ncbi:MAG: hypothetical protein R2792_15640 [Saprospiraceae bacterium]
MTLSEFFTYVSENPMPIVAFFIFIPLVALMVGFFGKNKGHESPWKYVYSALIYGVCIPGIFAVALSVYLFLFERGSIMNTNLVTQVAPIASMFVTLGLIRRNTRFEYIPGFDRISGLMLMIGSIFFIMYLLDRTHLIAFVRLNVEYLFLIVVVALLVFRYALKNFIR